MVLEHQTSTQNALTKAAHAAQRAMHMQTSLQKELGEPVSEVPSGTAERIIQHAVDDALDVLLFKDEAALPKGGIQGDAAFVEAFTANAPVSKEGRTLKDMQLLNRLFKYRCSYLIYGITFKNLIPQLKQPLLASLHRILTSDTPPERYAYLQRTERQHIHQILLETLADYAEEVESQ
jgi:hypothetical protein